VTPAELTPWQWGLALLGALCTGLGKGGLSGVGNLTVVIFVLVFPARASVGLLLPILIAADLVAVTLFRRDVVWGHLVKLLPWAAVGLAVGTVALGRFDDQAVRRMIGGILVLMTVVHLGRDWQRRRAGANGADGLPHTVGFQAATGILSGFATMVANAAGPVANLYLLAAGLPKLAFIGTAAWFFFIVNVVKVPVQASLGLITLGSLSLSLCLAPAAVIGVFAGRWVVHRINQRLFEALIWIFIVIAALRLLW